MMQTRHVFNLLSCIFLASLCVAQTPYEDVRNTLRSLERERPRPVTKMLEVTNKTINSEQWVDMTDSQKSEILDFPLEAAQREKGSEEAMKLAETIMENDSITGDASWHLRFRKAEFAFGTSDKGQSIRLAEKITESPEAPEMYKGRAEMLIARAYDYGSRPSIAIQHAEKALELYDKAFAEGAAFGYDTVNEIKWAGTLAREDLLDSEKAILFFKKMMEYTDGEYWEVPAKIEIALVHRQNKEFDKAQAIYDEIEQMEDSRFSTRAMLPSAEMVWYEMGDAEKGKELMKAVLVSEAQHHDLRYRTLLAISDYLTRNGQYDESLKWLNDNIELPHQPEKTVEKYRSTILYRMGQIYQRKGQTEKAKEAFRNAKNAEGGNMDDRINARDALERIEYYE